MCILTETGELFMMISADEIAQRIMGRTPYFKTRVANAYGGGYHPKVHGLEVENHATAMAI